MPEGHVLHRIAGEFQESFQGRRVSSSSPQGRFSEAADLDGAELTDAWAKGKHLFVGFDGLDEQVHVHLGLYGAFTFTPRTDLDVVGLVRWRLETDTHTMDLRGPSRCELLTPPEVDSILERLGPDPIDPRATPERFLERLARSRRPIAALLLDQSVVSGVGNVYRAEVLFRLGIDPMTPGTDLDEVTAQGIWKDLGDLMAVGVERGRIDTVREEHEPEVMGRPPRQDDHGGEVYVYRRDGKPCHVCGEQVSTTVLDNRNLFWCRTCQGKN